MWLHCIIFSVLNKEAIISYPVYMRFYKSGGSKEGGLMKKEIFVLLALASLLLVSCSRFSTEGLPDKGIIILSPKANESVGAGTSYEIEWKAEVSAPEFGEVVTVEFTKDAGKAWEVVGENVPKGGKYLWKVPKTDSAQCKIRVFSQRRAEYRGTSGVFAVK